MGFVVKSKGGDFKPAPEGLYLAVCVDVVDLGEKETQWGMKHMAQLVWEIDAKMEDGRPFTVRKRYTASLHPKSVLNKDLSSWRGRPFTQQELDGFDVETIIGASCQVLVQHVQKDNETYANVTAIMKVPAGKKLAPSGKYVRMQDRKPQSSQATDPGPAGWAEEDLENSVPF